MHSALLSPRLKRSATRPMSFRRSRTSSRLRSTGNPVPPERAAGFRNDWRALGQEADPGRSEYCDSSSDPVSVGREPEGIRRECGCVVSDSGFAGNGYRLRGNDPGVRKNAFRVMVSTSGSGGNSHGVVRNGCGPVRSGPDVYGNRLPVMVSAVDSRRNRCGVRKNGLRLAGNGSVLGKRTPETALAERIFRFVFDRRGEPILGPVGLRWLSPRKQAMERKDRPFLERGYRGENESDFHQKWKR